MDSRSDWGYGPCTVWSSFGGSHLKLNWILNDISQLRNDRQQQWMELSSSWWLLMVIWMTVGIRKGDGQSKFSVCSRCRDWAVIEAENERRMDAAIGLVSARSGSDRKIFRRQQTDRAVVVVRTGRSWIWILVGIALGPLGSVMVRSYFWISGVTG